MSCDRLLCSALSGSRFRSAALTQTLWTPPWAASHCTTPARQVRTPHTERYPERSCCCSARARSFRPPPLPPQPPTPAAVAAAVSGTPRLPPCLPLQPPPPPAHPPPRPPPPWSTTRLHTEARPTSLASYQSPKAWRSHRGASPPRRARACTTASWRSPTASASCPPACCPTWVATRLLPPWTRRAGAWEGNTSSRAPPPRTPATMERKSSAPHLKSKAYLRRKNKTCRMRNQI